MQLVYSAAFFGLVFICGCIRTAGFFSYRLSSCKPNDLFWDIKMFDFLRLSLKISLADDSGANCSSRRLFVSVPFLDDVVFFSTLALMNDSH